jgi:hypothetical protein
MAQPQLDVLSVGDVVTDAFIRLLDKEEKVEHERNGEGWLFHSAPRYLLIIPKSSPESAMPLTPR